MPDFNTPLSREEAILQNMLGAQNVLEPPMSRTEDLLLQILENGPRPTPEEVRQIIEDYIEDHPEVLTVDTDQIVDKAVTKAKLADALLTYLLPVIEAADEGKVLKVDNGEAKWLADSDNEYLLVTVTRSGTSPNFTYSADKTYAELRPFAEKGKCIIILGSVAYKLYGINPSNVTFINDEPYQGTANRTSEDEYGNRTFVEYSTVRYLITIKNDDTITLKTRTFNSLLNIRITVTNNSTLSEENYKVLYASQGNCTVGYISNNKYYYLQKCDGTPTGTVTEFDFVNYEIGIKAHIDANRLVTITEMSTDLLVTLTASGTAPNITYSTDYTYDEIRSAVESGRNVVLVYPTANATFTLYKVLANNVVFRSLDLGTSSAPSGTKTLSYLHEITVDISTNNIVYSDAVVSAGGGITVTNGATIAAMAYSVINRHFASGVNINVTTSYNNKKVMLWGSSCNDAVTEFEFVNTVEGIKATVNASRLVTITTL